MAKSQSLKRIGHRPAFPVLPRERDSLTQWLNSKFGQDIPAVIEARGKKKREVVSPPVPAPLVKERLAEVVYRNGGHYRITGWGDTVDDQGIYGVMGLDAPAAFDLMYFYGYLVGYGRGLGQTPTTMLAEVQKVIEEVWREKEAAAPSETR